MIGHISETDGHWLAGLTDGEGCFSLAVNRRNNGKHRRIEFVYQIALRADDGETLEHCMDILGVGQMSRNKGARFVTSPNGTTYKGNPLWKFFVRKRSEISVVIATFKKYPLRSKKRLDFELWAQAFERYMKEISDTPRIKVRYGQRYRSRVGIVHTPIIGTPLKQMRSIPEELFLEMKTYSNQIKRVRVFKEAQLSGTTV